MAQLLLPRIRFLFSGLNYFSQTVSEIALQRHRHGLQKK